MQGLYNAKISRPILTGFTERVKKYPDVPCTKEFGIANYLGRWRGFVLKAGTPEPIVKYLEWLFRESFNTKEYQDFLVKEVGHERPAYAGTTEFKKFVSEEKEDFVKVLKELGFIK
jgi:tripartite-type tricarboxylate transporter receptor subunit TctC